MRFTVSSASLVPLKDDSVQHVHNHSLKGTFKVPDDTYIKVDGRQAQNGLSC